MDRRGHRGKVLQVVNAYFQRVGKEDDYRPGERALWDEILSDEDCVLAGDFNAHSTMWNPRCANRRDATSLENLTRAFDLRVLTDERPTRPSDGLHSIIGLALAP